MRAQLDGHLLNMRGWANYHDTSYSKIHNLCAYHITWCKPTKQHWERQTIYLPKLRWDGLEINIRIVLE